MHRELESGPTYAHYHLSSTGFFICASAAEPLCPSPHSSAFAQSSVLISSGRDPTQTPDPTTTFAPASASSTPHTPSSILVFLSHLPPATNRLQLSKMIRFLQLVFDSVAQFSCKIRFRDLRGQIGIQYDIKAHRRWPQYWLVRPTRRLAGPTQECKMFTP